MENEAIWGRDSLKSPTHKHISSWNPFPKICAIKSTAFNDDAIQVNVIVAPDVACCSLSSPSPPNDGTAITYSGFKIDETLQQ